MDWEKSKTLMIVLFALLNAGLFIFNIRVAESYKITPGEVSSITKILADNDIILDCSLPSENKPRRYINVSAADWDYQYIKEVFFPSAPEITRTYEEGSIIYGLSSTGETVAVTNAFTSGVSKLVYSDPKAARTPEEYKNLLSGRFSSLALQRVIINEEGNRYVYNDAQKNDVIFASMVEVVFSPDGSVTVSAAKYNFDSYTEAPREIFSADEAMLTFMHYKKDKLAESVTIEDVRLGYSVDGAGFERNHKAKPCYRIFIVGTIEPVYIDAVMNTVMDVAP